jgi:hypothetical protein
MPYRFVAADSSGSSSDPLALFAVPDGPADALDNGPASDVHPIDPTKRRLFVDTGLRGELAKAAWLTVSGIDGFLFFEGPVGDNGCVEVSFEGAPHVERVHVLLETPRRHRLAEVTLNEGWTEHAFA